MPAPISVIIPTLNSEQNLPSCLGALSEALTAGLLAQVIFADGGSEDGTLQIADEVGASLVSSPAGRGIQLANAAHTTRGEWLLFLHSDSVLEAGWTDQIQNYLRDSNQAHYFKLKFDDKSFKARLVAFWANTRAFVFKLPYGDQGLLISRQLYDDVGGYADFPLMEDVDMAQKLRRNLSNMPITIETSAQKYRDQGWFYRSFRNFRILMRYKLGADPVDLAKDYQR